MCLLVKSKLMWKKFKRIDINTIVVVVSTLYHTFKKEKHESGTHLEKKVMNGYSKQ